MRTEDLFRDEAGVVPLTRHPEDLDTEPGLG
jgi:hypothetical protein